MSALQKSDKVVQSSNPPRSRLRRSFVVGLLLVMLALLGIALYRIPSVNRFITLSTTHQPERVTELYFTNYNAIPKQVTAGNTYTISFTIVNHEARPTTYSYETSVNVNGQATPLSTGSLTLTDAQIGEAQVPFTPTIAGSLYQLTIKLTNVNQEINVRLHS